MPFVKQFDFYKRHFTSFGLRVLNQIKQQGIYNWLLDQLR